MAVAAEGDRRRIYVEATEEHVQAAAVAPPADVPDAELPAAALGFRVQAYGMQRWSDLFSARQLLALVTLSDLVKAARARVIADAQRESAWPREELEAYADAVCTYLAFAVGKHADYGNALVSWYPQEDRPSHLFTQAAVPRPADFCELNPLANVGGAWTRCVKVVSESFETLGFGSVANVAQGSALNHIDGGLISTDPPYYASIGYADLSDFFYIWLRRSLRGSYPDLLSTVLVPKAEELVANPHRQDGDDGAREHFESGFREFFRRARTRALSDFPITVYYAYKQTESNGAGTTSSGWEAILTAIVETGWSVTATWPVRSERSGRMRDIRSNALASSIVLALRPRQDDASTADRRGLIQALHAELPAALRKLQQGAVSPVDLHQAAIGPGMAVFSRYSKVIESDGTPMTVGAAYTLITDMLDQVLNEQEGDFDTPTRFAIAWYRQHGYASGAFGVADNMARARNTSVETVVREGILTSAAGKVRLMASTEYPEDYDVLNDDRVGVWEVLHHLIARLERGGLPQAGDFLSVVEARPDAAVDVELVKELAFLLFSIAENNGWTQDALAFNTIATAWPDIVDAARSATTPAGVQTSFDLSEEG
jgi:putative DNA methylase